MPELVTLENGLRVVVIPVPHARSVSLSAYVAAGARYEAAPDAGLSHFVEHLCFKGTERRPRPQDISAEIDALGGAMNAATDQWALMPPNWEAMRVQWELSHAVSAILTLCALLALVRSVLVWGSERSSAP